MRGQRDTDGPGRGRYPAHRSLRLVHSGRRRSAPRDGLRIRSASSPDAGLGTGARRGRPYRAHGKLDGLPRRRSRDLVRSRLRGRIFQQFLLQFQRRRSAELRLHAGQPRLDPEAERQRHALESIQATRASTAGKLSASDTFAQSSYVRWTVSLSNTQGQQTATRVYHTIPESGDGSAGTNYDETMYGYDALGRQNMVRSPGGTITRTVFDRRGPSCLHLCGHR